jgi:hypothetical protein
LQSGKCKGGGDQGKDREASEKKKQWIRFSGRQKAKRMEMAQEGGKKKSLDLSALGQGSTI